MRELAKRTDALIARSYVSLEEQREILARTIEKTEGIKMALSAIRNKN